MYILARRRLLQMFHNGGLFASVITLLVAAFVACDNMIVLIRCAEFTGKHSFGQVLVFCHRASVNLQHGEMVSNDF